MSCKVGTTDVADIKVGTTSVAKVVKDGVTLWESDKPWCEGAWTMQGTYDFVWNAATSRFEYTTSEGFTDYLRYYSDVPSRWIFYAAQTSTSLYVYGTGREKALTFTDSTGTEYSFVWSKT